MAHAAVKLGILCGWLASALYVHFRGRVRHRLKRDLIGHAAVLAPYNSLMYLFSAVPRDPLLDPGLVPELATLRSHWQTIRDEALALLREGQIVESEKRQDIAFNSFFRRGWRRFYLSWYGAPLPSAARHCPRTLELLRQCPNVRAALFALLPPGSKLGAHRDPFAGSLRYHLGLSTPNDDACWIRVDGRQYSWRDGEDVLFDETYVHEARNDTDRPRLILFCDVARPLRTPVLRWLNRAVSRLVVPITASNNFAGERVGAVNLFAGLVYRYGQLMQRFKRWNRKLYRASKYALLAAAIALVALL